MSKLVVDSRSQIEQGHDMPYATSESGEQSWGQPPASHYIFALREGRIIGRQFGYYVSSASSVEFMEAALEREFMSWELASDEDLLQFEEGLD